MRGGYGEYAGHGEYGEYAGHRPEPRSRTFWERSLTIPKTF